MSLPYASGDARIAVLRDLICRLADVHSDDLPPSLRDRRAAWSRAGGSAADLDALVAEVVRLRAERRDALTDWCDECYPVHGPNRPADAQPARLLFTWSDREAAACDRHIALTIARIVLDHSYDRVGLEPRIECIGQVPEVCLPPSSRDHIAVAKYGCAAARAYLDRVAPAWCTETVHLTEEEARALEHEIGAAMNLREGGLP